MKDLLFKVCQAWKDLGYDEEIGPILSFGTDGDFARRKLYASLLRPLRPGEISDNPNLKFMDMRTCRLHTESDYKHNFKRPRNLFINLTREIHIGDAVFGRDLLVEILTKYAVQYGQPSWHTLVNVKDKQDVSSACALFPIALKCAEACVQNGDYTDSPSKLKSLNGLLVYCKLWVTFYEAFYDLALDVEARLRKLSTCAHLLLCIYLENSTSFIPSVLYFDMMSLIKTAFTLVNIFKRDYPHIPFYLQLLGSDLLEMLFSIVRTIHHGTNFDALILQHRLQYALTIEKIYHAHPSWRQKNKKTSGGDKIDLGSIDEAICMVGNVIIHQA